MGKDILAEVWPQIAHWLGAAQQPSPDERQGHSV
jgi:hypothetical protein